MHFNEILSRERKAQHLSQEELASRIQVSRQAVSKWETGDAMPDLNKLLALADALGISLDVLCGRTDHTAAAEAEPISPHAKRRPRLLPFFCGLLVGILAAAGLWACLQQNIASAEESPAHSPLAQLSEEFTVTGLGFSPRSDNRLNYRFTPSFASENFTYQITFAGYDGTSYTFDAAYSGGVCSGEAAFDNPDSYTVTVSVTDGSSSHNLAVAMNLSFGTSQASWTPLVD